MRFVIKICAHDGIDSHNIPIETDAIVNAVPAAYKNGLLAKNDAKNIYSIECINAETYKMFIQDYRFTKTVVAAEYYDNDPSDMRAVFIQFKVPHPDFDIMTAVKAAAKDYCLSDEGKRVYIGNCHSFNWADFADIPVEYCEKYGFTIDKADNVDDINDLNEQLVIENEIIPEE